MATGTIKGVKVGTANVLANYGGKSCNISGTVNVVNITTTSGGSTQVGSTLTLGARSAALQSIAYKSGGPSTSYYVVGGTQTIAYPTVTATYAVSDHTSTTIYYTGFKNKPTLSSLTGFSTSITETTTSNPCSGSIKITTTGTGASKLSSTLTISDGSTVIKSITVESAAITLSKSVTATGYSADTSGILTISGTTLNAAKIGTTTLNATYTESGVTKSCNISGTHYVGSISTPANITRTRTLSSIEAGGDNAGSDNVSVLVGATATYTKPDKIIAHYSINAGSGSSTGSYSGFGGDIALSSTNGVVVTSVNASDDTYTLTSSNNTTVGSSTITATVGGVSVRGFSKSVSVSNPVTDVDITDYAGAGVEFKSSDESIMTVS